MGSLRLITITVSSLLAFWSTGSARTPMKGGDIAWVTDYVQAYKQAQSENKPVLVYVWTEKQYIVQPSEHTAETSVPYHVSGEIHPLSHRYTKGMWDSKKVADESRRFVCLSVNIDQSDAFAQRCLQQRAQVFITDPQGNVLKKYTGRNTGLMKVFEPDDMLRVMRKLKWPPAQAAPN